MFEGYTPNKTELSPRVFDNKQSCNAFLAKDLEKEVGELKS